jgi:hypothetical protein
VLLQLVFLDVTAEKPKHKVGLLEPSEAPSRSAIAYESPQLNCANAAVGSRKVPDMHVLHSSELIASAAIGLG